MNRLPFVATLTDAFGFVWQNRKDFLAFAYLPVIANSLIGVALHLSLPKQMPSGATEMLASLSSLAYALWAFALIAAFGFYVAFAVAWHRRCLLPGETPTVGAALRWHGRHWRFLGIAALLGVGLLLAAIIANTIVGVILHALTSDTGAGGLVVSILVSFIVITIFTRFLPIFPAIAVDDRNVTLGAAWRMTRGNGIALFTMLFSLSLIIALVNQGIQIVWVALLGPLAADGSVLAVFVLVLLTQLLTFIGVALTTTVASIAYRDLSARPGSSSGGGGGTTV